MENNKKRPYLFNILRTTHDIVEYSIKTQDDEFNKINDFFELKNRIDLVLDDIFNHFDNILYTFQKKTSPIKWD